MTTKQERRFSLRNTVRRHLHTYNRPKRVPDQRKERSRQACRQWRLA